MEKWSNLIWQFAPIEWNYWWVINITVEVKLHSNLVEILPRANSTLPQKPNLAFRGQFRNCGCALKCSLRGQNGGRIWNQREILHKIRPRPYQRWYLKNLWHTLLLLPSRLDLGFPNWPKNEVIQNWNL